MRSTSTFSRLARGAAVLAGHPGTFALAVSSVLIWALTGPVFGFSDTWQLVINTATTIITFLMVFLIQNSQNRDTIAIHLKLDELVRAVQEARNSVIDLEDLDEAELGRLLAQYRKLAEEGRSAGSDRSVIDPQAEASTIPAREGVASCPLDR